MSPEDRDELLFEDEWRARVRRRLGRLAEAAHAPARCTSVRCRRRRRCLGQGRTVTGEEAWPPCLKAEVGRPGGQRLRADIAAAFAALERGMAAEEGDDA